MEQINCLEEWYSAHCDGDWEHGGGIKIESLDNPGWSVTINLAGTELEKMPFSEMSQNDVSQRYEDNQDWWVCRKVGVEFQGKGGPKQLSVILHIFAEWSRSAGN